MQLIVNASGEVTIVPDTDHEQIIVNALINAENGRVDADSTLAIKGRQLEGQIIISIKQSAKKLNQPGG